MVGLIALLFLVVPLVELFVIIQVGSAIGALNTIAVLLAISVLGAWLMKREGLGVIRRLQAALGSGRYIGRELMDGAMILFGGALMLTPGFLTDVAGLALLAPPVRAALRPWLVRRLMERARRPRRGTGFIDA